MKTYRMIVGLFSFSIGLVLLFNLNAVLPSTLFPKLVTEVVIAVLFFGGLMLMALSRDWNTNQKSQNAAKGQNMDQPRRQSQPKKS